MDRDPKDLIRVADLVRLAAQTAKTFSNTTGNGEMSRITEIAQRMEAAAEELGELGREMAAKASETGGST